MMSLFSAIKRGAKNAMRGHFGGAALIMLIQFGVAMLISTLQQIALGIFVIRPALSEMTVNPFDQSGYFEILSDYFILSGPEWIITGAAIILQALLVFPLSLGSIRWYSGIINGGNPSITEIFHFYETGKAYIRAIWCNITLSIRVTLWSVLFSIVPGTVFSVSVIYLTREGAPDRLKGMMATTGVCISILMFVALIVLLYAFINRYALTAYLLCEDDSLSVGKAIKTSIAYTRRSRFSLLWFCLSFFGWFMLCIFFVPIFYVTPYFTASFVMYAKYIAEKNRRPE